MSELTPEEIWQAIAEERAKQPHIFEVTSDVGFGAVRVSFAASGKLDDEAAIKFSELLLKNHTRSNHRVTQKRLFR